MEEEILRILIKEEVIDSSGTEWTPLSGGVSSDIYKIRNGDKKLVIKQALRKLKVERDWYADVRRNNTEQDFLRFMEGYFPAAVPAVVYTDRNRHFFVMEFLDDRYENWKSQLFAGKFDDKVVERAAHLLAEIHNISRKEVHWQRVFNDYKSFYDLRIEPYFVYTGRQHPVLDQFFQEESNRLKEYHEVLIHGDFSPKNIMVHPDKVVILDHEVACYGDPAFDLAFLLTHLYLKMIYHYFRSGQIYDMAEKARMEYLKKAAEPDLSGFDFRTGRLLLMMLLARIDGKSPVQYLNKKSVNFIRLVTLDLLKKSVFSPQEINVLIKERLKRVSI